MSNHALEELKTDDMLCWECLKTYLWYHSKLAHTRVHAHIEKHADIHTPNVTSISSERSASEMLFHKNASHQRLSQKVLTHLGGTPAEIPTAIFTI